MIIAAVISKNHMHIKTGHGLKSLVTTCGILSSHLMMCYTLLHHKPMCMAYKGICTHCIV